jgi:predicted nucleic acid-binding protein
LGTQGERIVVVSDTDVVINFVRVQRLDLLCTHSNFRVLVTEHLLGSSGILGELTNPKQAVEAEKAVEAGLVEVVALTEPGELALFATLNQFLGRGESAAIAVAANHGWIVATDDRKAHNECRRVLGPNRSLNTPGILLGCIRNGSLTVADADAIKDQLTEQQFIMKFTSFAELLEEPPA